MAGSGGRKGTTFFGNSKGYREKVWIDAQKSTNYAEEVGVRYRELRDDGIIDVGYISSLLDNWYDSVCDFYDSEWNRWPESKCISEVIVNDGWKLIDTGYNQPLWNDSTVYQPGDRCVLSSLVWEATETSLGVIPFAQLGYTDSLQRYKDWIRRQTPKGTP